MDIEGFDAVKAKMEERTIGGQLPTVLTREELSAKIEALGAKNGDHLQEDEFCVRFDLTNEEIGFLEGKIVEYVEAYRKALAFQEQKEAEYKQLIKDHKAVTNSKLAQAVNVSTVKDSPLEIFPGNGEMMVAEKDSRKMISLVFETKDGNFVFFEDVAEAIGASSTLTSQMKYTMP